MKETPLSNEENLRQQLIEVEQFPYSSVNAYLASLPPNEANDLLARIAEDADRARPTIWSYILAVFLVVIFLGMVSDVPGGRGPIKQQAGIRAALYLARRGDVRSFVPLARSWDSRRLSKSSYQDTIEQSLISLLAGTPGGANLPLPTEALTDLARRVWHAKRLSRDITPSQRDLLLSSLRHLSGRGGTAQALLQELQAGGHGGNREQVQRTARTG